MQYAEFVLRRLNCSPPSEPLDVPLPSKKDLLELRYQFPKEKLGYVYIILYTDFISNLTSVTFLFSICTILKSDRTKKKRNVCHGWRRDLAVNVMYRHGF